MQRRGRGHLIAELAPAFLRIGRTDADRVIYDMSADALDSADIALNGAVLRDDNGTLPTLAPLRVGNGPADLPPLTMAFVVYPDAEAGTVSEPRVTSSRGGERMTH